MGSYSQTLNRGTLALLLFALGACSDTPKGTTSALDTGIDAGLVTDTGILTCSDSQCAIEGVCYENGAANPSNDCEACIVVIAREGWTPNDEGICDDSDACTSDDGCKAGLCQGIAKECGDDNPCTDDSCNPSSGECATTNNDLPCDDGNPCTEGSECSGGSCAPGPTPTVCDDENPCTVDSCDPVSGCEAAAIENGETCDDDDSCTIKETCTDGECTGEAVMDCDDGNACTVDICDVSAGCSHESIAAQCIDDNPCTDDLCDPSKGCVYPFTDIECDDESVCTEKDKCVEGACLGGPVSIDDGNPCTTDACTPETGVTHAVNSDPCDDGDACTLGDTCKTGVCQSGESYLQCDDDNVCTDDWCEAVKGCMNDANTVVCDDDSACTTDDVCADKTCDGSTIDCDDGKQCTVDSCNPVTGCKNVFELTNTCRPNFSVSFPTRGQTVKGSTNDMTLTVKGVVQSEAGSITSLKVNGANVTPAANGQFSHKINVQIGGNVIVLEAKDSMGTTRERVQSFLWSSNYKKPTSKASKNGIVTEGLGLWLDQDAIDDGNRNYNAPKNLATLAEMVVAGFDVYDSIENPAAESWAYDLYITGLAHDPPLIGLQTKNGYLRLNGTINDVVANYKVDTLFDFTGKVTISKIALEADVELKVQSHKLKANVKNVSVTINDNDIDIDGDGLTGNIAAFIGGFFKGTLAETLESQFETTLKNQVGPMLESALGSLTLAQQFNLPALALDGSTIALDLVSDFDDVTVGTKGIELIMRAGGYATSATPYDGGSYLGVPSRVNCGVGTQNLSLPQAQELEASLADDTLNSLFFAAWRGGLLEFVVPEAMLGEVDVSDYGITDLELKVSGMVAPTLSDCNEDNAARVFLGDVKIDADLKLLGLPMGMTIWASLGANVEIEPTSPCLASATGGCPANEPCQLAVCAIDNFCCINQWDASCEDCAYDGVGFNDLDCSSAVVACQDGIGITLGDIAEMNTEVLVTNDELLPMEAVINTLIKEHLLPNLTAQLAGSFFTVPLPKLDIGGVGGLPNGTSIGFQPTSDKRIGGNTIIQGTFK
jgi:hypothetical protein